jgi:ABC-type sugar transport system permease subunit
MMPRFASDTRRAWLLCAPACLAMVLLNILPACRELMAGEPRTLAAATSSWAIALFVVGLQTLAVCAASAIIEAPLGFAIAVVLLHRTAHVRTPERWFAAAVAAGFVWRLAFGGSLGFLDETGSPWAVGVAELWRTLPLVVLLFYIPMRRSGIVTAEVAQLDGAGRSTIVRRVYWPLARPALLVLMALRGIDYLRAVETPLISPLGAQRAAWVLLLLAVTAVASRAARPHGDLT